MITEDRLRQTFSEGGAQEIYQKVKTRSEATLFNDIEIMKENRIVFVDYLRVVACFLVMLVHAS